MSTTTRAATSRAANDSITDDSTIIGRIPGLLQEKPANVPALRDALSALRRRIGRSQLSSLPDGATLEHLLEAVQGALSESRVSSRRTAAEAYRRDAPVRTAILSLLTSGPATTTELAERAGFAVATVSRELRELRDEDLVVVISDPDRRRRPHILSELGEARAADLSTYAQPPDLPGPLLSEIAVAALDEALDAAVELRRRTSRRQDALERLCNIERRARQAAAHDVAVRALNEILTTLRQDSQGDAFEPYLERLDRIAKGVDSEFPATYAVPALAYLEYQLGRRPNKAVATRAGHLLTACNMFARLGDDAHGHGQHWRSWQGWAHAALADALRQQFELASAIESASGASEVFKSLDDPYGTTRSRFLIGFCLRLRGQFIEAAKHLDFAYRLATEHGFRAFAADALMQLGEVNRCQGDLPTATAMLSEALGQARELRLPLTRAFADSALAAVTHQQGNEDEALSRLSRAHQVFVERGYDDGIALNLRREAIVLRESATGRAGLRAAEKRLGEAKSLYSRLLSPAGVVACGIEAGYLCIARKLEPAEECVRLLEWLEQPLISHMLELDPWVPTMLVSFAEAADHEELQGAAVSLLERSNRVLARHEAETGLSMKKPMVASRRRCY